MPRGLAHFWQLFGGDSLSLVDVSRILGSLTLTSSDVIKSRREIRTPIRLGSVFHPQIPRCLPGGCVLRRCKQRRLLRFFEKLLAEGVGFEPTVGLLLRLISSQVPSTTQPPFRYA